MTYPEKIYIGQLCDGSLAVCNDEYAVEYVRKDKSATVDAQGALDALDKLQNCGDWLAQGFTMDMAHKYIETIRAALTQSAEKDAVINECINVILEKIEIFKQPEYAYPNGCLNSQIVAKGLIKDLESLKTHAETIEAAEKGGVA